MQYIWIGQGEMQRVEFHHFQKKRRVMLKGVPDWWGFSYSRKRFVVE